MLTLDEADATLQDPDPGRGPTSFVDWRTRVFAPPLLLTLAWAINHTPVVFFLRGFHVWVHEVGHSAVAWFSGYRATPLPFGWANVAPVHSNFVYGGVLFLLCVLGWAGWTQRRPAPIALAVAGIAAQAWLTWRTTEWWKDEWIVFGGIGGEFVLSTLAMLLFFVRLPAWFRWGACRYVVFFLAASTLLVRWEAWLEIHKGVEELPLGSMLHGEEDPNGDMNRLLDDHGWTHAGIRRTYYLLGQGCFASLAATYVWFAFQFDRLVTAPWRRGSETGDGKLEG